MNEAKIPLIQLAPMEGVLDWVLREMLSEIGGVDRMVTEFVRVTDKIVPDHVFYKYSPELLHGGRTRAGVPVFVQLLGGQPEWVAENAVRAASLGAPGVDLNFGCPAKTVNRHDGGAALLKEPERVFQICSAVRRAVAGDVPVTAKVRLGFDHKDYHREIASAVSESGMSHIVVHCRTKMEMYTPPAHWEYIPRMSAGLDLPFLANGEIWSVEDYHRCVAVAGVERVALGRGLVSRPTLALEIRESAQARNFDPVGFLEEFFHRSVTFRNPHYGVARLKQILRYWSRENATFARWFQTVKIAENVDHVVQFLQMIKAESSSREDIEWPKFKSTLGPTAPTASAPSSF